MNSIAQPTCTAHLERMHTCEPAPSKEFSGESLSIFSTSSHCCPLRGPFSKIRIPVMIAVVINQVKGRTPVDIVCSPGPTWGRLEGAHARVCWMSQGIALMSQFFERENKAFLIKRKQFYTGTQF
ncbi:hypothetical protein Ddc_14020 [Ditylenchus destructor]|nr:hypothetical protein Ddc_14020 [Ditylenchus destructor]